MSTRNTLTTAAGIPVPDNQTSLTAGERGPTLLQDHYAFGGHVEKATAPKGDTS